MQVCLCDRIDIWWCKQIKEEMAGCLDFLKCIYGVFGFPFQLRLSTRPEKFLGEVEEWDAAEKVSLSFFSILNDH